MPARFGGFPAEGIAFLRVLSRHNNRDWFLPRKAIFDQSVKAPMTEMVAALNQEMMAFAPAYVTDPDKAIYRIYRDVRFSADKTPYKDHIAASFSRRGMMKHQAAGYYFSVSAKEIEVGGGIYLPPPETLRAVREHMAENHAEFRRMVGAREVCALLGEVQGERLSRVPKGFPPLHPAADLLRFKQYLLYVVIEPSVAATPKLFEEVLERFRAMTPFIDFLNAPLVAANRKKSREVFFR